MGKEKINLYEAYKRIWMEISKQMDVKLAELGADQESKLAEVKGKEEKNLGELLKDSKGSQLKVIPYLTASDDPEKKGLARRLSAQELAKTQLLIAICNKFDVTMPDNLDNPRAKALLEIISKTKGEILKPENEEALKTAMQYAGFLPNREVRDMYKQLRGIAKELKKSSGPLNEKLQEPLDFIIKTTARSLPLRRISDSAKQTLELIKDEKGAFSGAKQRELILESLGAIEAEIRTIFSRVYPPYERQSHPSMQAGRVQAGILTKEAIKKLRVRG